MRILVAVDGSKSSDEALSSVGSREWPGDSEFLIVSVAEPEMTDLGGWVTEITKECHQKFISRGLDYLKGLLPGQQISGKLAEGTAADEIARIAREWSADFIVVGSCAKRGISHFVLGSVAEDVVHKAPCSVEVIKMQRPVQTQETSASTTICPGKK